MTVSANPCRNDYTAVASQTVYNYTFGILASSDLAVYVDEVLSTDYTVTGVGTATGGTIVFGTAPTAGLAIAIVSNMPVQRTTAYVDGGPFPASTVNSDVDRAVMLTRQHEEILARTMRLQPYSTVDDLTVDDPVAGQVLVWGDANDITSVPIANLGSIVADEHSPLSGYTTAAFPTPTGSLAYLTDGNRGVTLRKSTGLVPINGGVHNVKDFGAKGDGTTDDTAAVQAAITLASSSTNTRVVLFPPGVYVVSTLTVENTGWNVVLSGQGSGGIYNNTDAISVLKAKSGMTGAILYLDAGGSSGGTVIRDLKIDGNDEAGVTYGIYYNNDAVEGYHTFRQQMQNVVIVNLATAIGMESQTQSLHIDRLVTFDVDLGLDITAGSTGCIEIYVTNSRILVNDRVATIGPDSATYGDGAQGVHFVNCAFGSGYLANTTSMFLVQNARVVGWHNCWLEHSSSYNCTDAMIVLGKSSASSAVDCIIENCHFLGNGKANYAINVVKVINPIIVGNNFEGINTLPVLSTATNCRGHYLQNYWATAGMQVSSTTGWRTVEGEATNNEPNLFSDLKFIGASGTTFVNLRSTGDTAARVALRNDGLRYSDGAASPDVVISRSTTSTFNVSTGSTPASRVTVSDTLATVTLPVLKSAAGNLVSHNYGAAAVDWTLTTLESAADTFVVTNASGAVNMIFPAAIPGKNYTVLNTSGQVLTVKVASQTGHTIASTKTAIGYMNATDCVEIYEQP